MDDSGPDIEILELAISKEVEAYHFFMALAERVDSPEMRKVFENLAQEELRHKAKLELEVLKLGHTISLNQQMPRPSKNYIVSDTDTPLDMDYADMLLLGIEKENASFRSYVNLLQNVRDPQSREVLLAIAEEEIKHKLRFEMEYDALSKKR